MKQWPLIALFLLLSLIGRTQFVDDYSDGDFTSNPTWSGDDSIFIVNSSERLQLNATVPGDAYLFASHGLTQLADREWRFTVQYDFSPSGSNGGETYFSI